MTKEEFILSTVPAMAKYTFGFITTVIGIKSPAAGELVGSGLRAIVNGRRAIITASHVIEQADSYPMKFALSAGYGQHPYIVAGKIKVDRVGDLAVYYLPDDFPANRTDVSFWPEHHIQRSSERVATDFLFTHGYPGARARFLQLVDGLPLRSLPYGAMQRLEPPVPCLQPYEFAIEFDPSGIRPLDEHGAPIFEMPHGMSGSPVWRIGISGRSRDEWSPQLSLVVGFLTQWHPKEKVLVATSTERLTALLGHE